MNKNLKIGLIILGIVIFLVTVITLIYLGTRKLSIEIKKEGDNARFKITEGFKSTETLIYLKQNQVKQEKFKFYDVFIATENGMLGINIYAGDIAVKGASLNGSVIQYFNGAVPNG